MSTAALDLDITLSRFARQAQSLTLAGGAAIALAPDGEDSGDEMTYRASSGRDAPRVGARLRLVPAFKHECVREGKPLRCDDSETDTRVDRDRCRSLGIRSVVAVPLKSKESVVGILEIFSSRTKAFTESHMAKLHALAECVSDAVTGVEPAPAALVAPASDLLWADVFLESRLPWKRLLQSALCHVILAGAVWNFSLNWAKSEAILSRAISHSPQLTYSPSLSFPAAGSHPQQVKAAARGVAQLAAIVVKAEQRSSAPKVDMPAAGRVELAGLRAELPNAPPASVASPQRASLASKGLPDSAPASIVAPPPQIGGAIRHPGVATPGSFAVAPSPTVDGPVRNMASAGVGRFTVVGPAPGLPSRQGVTGPGISLGGVRAVVGPPPSMPLHEGSGAVGLTLGGGATVVGPPTALPLHQGTGGSRMSLGGSTVVGPAASLQGGLRQGSGVLSATLGGGDAVVAPAPDIPAGARSDGLSAGLGETGTVVGPPPGIPSGAREFSSSGFGGSGISVEPAPPSGGGIGGNGSGQGTLSGNGSGSGHGSGLGAGSGSGSAPSPSLAAVNPLGGGSGSDAKNIRTSVAPQAPTHLDDPAGRILDVPLRVIGLALALPNSSFFSNYEVFIAEREYARNETQLIKLVYESRPTQRRLSDYGVSVATTYKLRVKRDPACDESAAQITGGHYSEMQSASPDAALRDADKDSVLPCYRTSADDYQKAAASKR